MCIFKFSTIDEVLKRANDTQYGLAAGVCTADIHCICASSNNTTVYTCRSILFVAI
jgi:acyl-CoA reductase-like NAD-dependent aldehyde dehydrogenase